METEAPEVNEETKPFVGGPQSSFSVVPLQNIKILSRPLQNLSMRECIANHIKAIIRNRQRLLQLQLNKKKASSREIKMKKLEKPFLVKEATQ